MFVCRDGDATQSKKENDVFDMITQQIKVFELEFIQLPSQEGIRYAHGLNTILNSIPESSFPLLPFINGFNLWKMKIRENFLRKYQHEIII